VVYIGGFGTSGKAGADENENEQEGKNLFHLEYFLSVFVP
jgi:hypothetical protein